MISRGFFSVFVSAFAVIFLISFFYSQSVQYNTQFHSAELGVVSQSLSKDWFMVRNALENFASDAILQKIATQLPPPGPNCVPTNYDTLEFNDAVEAYWDNATLYMNTNFGTNCDVNLSVYMQNRLEGLALTSPSVRDDKRAYGILSCTRASSNSSLTVSRPFVIHKNIVITPSFVNCNVEVFDVLGSNSLPGSTPYSKLDVSQVFT